MEKKYVYVVFHREVENCEILFTSIRAFGNETEAKQFFEEIKKGCTSRAIDNDYSIEDEENMFFAYEDGYSTQNSIEISLCETEII